MAVKRLRATVQCVTERRAHKRIDGNPFAKEMDNRFGQGAPSTREIPSTRKKHLRTMKRADDSSTRKQAVPEMKPADNTSTRMMEPVKNIPNRVIEFNAARAACRSSDASLSTRTSPEDFFNFITGNSLQTL